MEKKSVLLITPKIGLGLLKLGMTPEQILDAIKTELGDFPKAGNREICISKEKEEDGFSLRYTKGSIFFMVRFRNNAAIEISVDRDISEYRTVTLYDTDIFHTPAEQIITGLKRNSCCCCDMEDEQLGTEFEFSEIGIRFWREDAFHEKLLADKSYMDKMSMVIEEMYRYLYFDIVTVKDID